MRRFSIGAILGGFFAFLFDPQSGRLYVAHLGDDMLTVFDTNTGKVVGDVKDLKSVHGVLAVPELHLTEGSVDGVDAVGCGRLC